MYFLSIYRVPEVRHLPKRRVTRHLWNALLVLIQRPTIFILLSVLSKTPGKRVTASRRISDLDGFY